MVFACLKKVVEIEYGGQKHRVTVRELTFGEYQKILRDAVTVKKLPNGMETLDVDAVKLQELVLLHAIEDAPFDVTEDGIKKLPMSVVMKIYDAVLEVNPFLGK